MILDPSAKGSAAIANDSVAQSSREPPGLPESHSDGHERANAGDPNDPNGSLDADVDADGETINAETYVVDCDKCSTEPPLRPSVPKDISHSSKKGGLALLGKSRRLSKAQRRAKLRKTTSTKDGSSVTHPKRIVYAPEADSTPAHLSLSSKGYRVSKKPKALLRPKRPATNHVTAPGVCDEEENQYKRCTRVVFKAQIDTENLWMNCSIGYMKHALKINDALCEKYKGDVVVSKKQRNKVEDDLRKMIKDQGDTLEAGIKYIVSCGAKELEFTQQWGGSRLEM